MLRGRRSDQMYTKTLKIVLSKKSEKQNEVNGIIPVEKAPGHVKHPYMSYKNNYTRICIKPIMTAVYEV